MEELKEKCKDIKIIVSAVDGVITDGLMPVDEIVNTPFKNYCIKDLEAINEIKKMHKFVFISQDNAINYNFFRRKKIPFYYAPGGDKDKIKILVEIMKKYRVKPDNILYVGCSYSDVECMHLAEVSFCTKDAPGDVGLAADYMLPARAGEGALCELYEVLKYIIK